MLHLQKGVGHDDDGEVTRELQADDGCPHHDAPKLVVKHAVCHILRAAVSVDRYLSFIGNRSALQKIVLLGHFVVGTHGKGYGRQLSCQLAV